MYLSSNLFTKSASKHLTGAFIAWAVAVVLLENTAFPLSVYLVIALAALAHPSNAALVYNWPCLLILNPVTSFKPISTDALALGGDARLYHLLKEVKQVRDENPDGPYKKILREEHGMVI